MTIHANAPLAVVEVDGREVHVVNRAQCRVCRSSHRAAVERGLINGLPPSTIVRQLPAVVDVNARNIREHRRRGHLPIDQDAVRAMQAEYRTGSTSKLAFDATVQEAAVLGMAAVVVQLVGDRLRSGALDVTVRDGLRAARLLATADNWRQKVRDAEARGRSVEQHRMRAVDRLLTLVTEIGGQDFLERLLAAAVNDEILGDVLLDGRLRRHLAARG